MMNFVLLMTILAGAKASVKHFEFPELTEATYDKKTNGKVVFIKFYAPWCGHCKKLAPVWDQLMLRFKKAPNFLVGSINCDGGGESLCASNGIRGYPTIKYGDPKSLKTYEGEKDQQSLYNFANKIMPRAPTCSPDKLELCTEKQKEDIKKFMDVPNEELRDAIIEGQSERNKGKVKFLEEVEKLQESHKKLKEDREKIINTIMDSGYITKKAVAEFKSTTESDSQEKD